MKLESVKLGARYAYYPRRTPDGHLQAEVERAGRRLVRVRVAHNGRNCVRWVSPRRLVEQADLFEGVGNE